RHRREIGAGDRQRHRGSRPPAEHASGPDFRRVPRRRGGDAHAFSALVRSQRQVLPGGRSRPGNADESGGPLMRISFNAAFEEGTRAINTASESLTEAQRQVSSGRRIGSPSDDPRGTSTAITEHATLNRVDAYTHAADALSSRLGLADAVLSD